MKEKLKKTFLSIKSLIIKHEFISWLLASIIFAFIIHCLFSKKAPTEWLAAEWTAGEILTYTSTVALGLLALWQNKRFKKANDKAQERMEELTKYANELTLKSQIIDAESKRIESLEYAFTSVMDLFNYYQVYLDYQKLSSSIDKSILITKRMEDNYRASVLLRDKLEMDKLYDTKELNALLMLCTSCVNNLLSLFKKNNGIRTDEIIELEEEYDKMSHTFMIKKIEYLQYTRTIFQKLIYENTSVKDIQSLYKYNNIIS